MCAMTLKPDNYEPPATRAGASRKVQPAMDLAKANPGRWVTITTLANKQSAASRASGLRKTASALGFEIAQDDCEVLVKYAGEPEPDGVQADPEPHWPEEPAPELATGGPVPAPHLGLPS